MACFSPMLRSASSCVVPLAVRSPRSLRTFHGVAVASNIGSNQRGGGSSRVLQFSTKTEAAKVEPRGGEENGKPEINGLVSEKNVKRAINRIVSEMDRKPMKEMAAPEELSLMKVFDDPDDSYVYFKWKYGYEIIKVEVDDDECYHDDECHQDDGNKYFNVTVTKRGCELQLNFLVRAYSDTLSITRLSLNKKVAKDSSGSDEEEEEEEEKDGSASEEEEEEMEKDGEEEEEDEDDYKTVYYHDPSYDGPVNLSKCAAVDENFLKDLLYYLEVRGINPTTTKFFFDHMENICRKRIDKGHMKWLKNLKRFFDH